MFASSLGTNKKTPSFFSLHFALTHIRSAAVSSFFIYCPRYPHKNSLPLYCSVLAGTTRTHKIQMTIEKGGQGVDRISSTPSLGMEGL